MLIYDLKLGYRCNNNCLHCVIADSRKYIELEELPIDLTYEECIEHIEYALNSGVKKIILTGGEPTLRQDFSLLLNKCREYGMCIGLQTNGRKLSDQKIINSIRSVDNISIIIAVHGSNSATHDLITQRQGSFDETIQGIKAVIDIGKEVIGKIVISKLNMNQISSILRLLNSIGVKHANIAFPHGQGNARINFESIVPRYKEISDYLYETIQTAKDNFLKIEFEAIPFCIIPYSPLMVGELQYLKKDRTIFSQVHESVQDWNIIRIAIKQKSIKCEKCFYDPICEGPWQEYIEHFGDEDIVPVPFSVTEREKLFKILSEIKKKPEEHGKI